MAVHFKNSGQSPALEVHTVVKGLWMPVGHKWPDTTYNQREAVGRLTLAPDTESAITGIHDAIPQADRDAIIAGNSRFFIYGSVWYRDIFRACHETAFCGVYDPKTKLVIACKDRNEIKDHQCPP
jgi:hypothetical protein